MYIGYCIFVVFHGNSESVIILMHILYTCTHEPQTLSSHKSFTHEHTLEPNTYWAPHTHEHKTHNPASHMSLQMAIALQYHFHVPAILLQAYDNSETAIVRLQSYNDSIA